MRTISPEGLEMLKEWEGLRLKTYRDPAGVLTIGYGHTSAEGEPIVKPGMEITEAEAETILRRDIARSERVVSEYIHVPLNDNQFAALVSFEYNTGSLHESTLRKKLNEGDYGAVPVELMKWIKITDRRTKKKKRSEGLVNRRTYEAALWAAGAPVANANADAHPDSPPLVTRESITWGAGVVATTGSLFNGNGAVQYVLAGVIAVSFAVGLFLFLKKRLKAG